MKSLFAPLVFKEILGRLDQLDGNAKRGWGKMEVGQMAWHCQIPLRTAIANSSPRKTANPLVALFFKKMMYSDRPMRKNLPTAPFLKARESKDFIHEKEILRQLVHEFYTLRNREKWNPHPIFGAFTQEQWGQMQYKHLDHHLRQFGV